MATKRVLGPAASSVCGLPVLWKPMLAAKPKPEELDALIPRLPYPMIGSPKLDGIRASVQNGVLLSRSLKPIRNAAMQRAWGKRKYDGYDGEITVGPQWAGDVFKRSTSQVAAADGGLDAAVWNVFDLHAPKPYISRLDLVRRNLDVSKTVVVHDWKNLRNSRELLAYEEANTTKGYEGIMARLHEGAYKEGRSTLRECGLVAIKRFVDAEALILECHPEQENTNEKKLNELGKMKRTSHKAGLIDKATLGKFVVRFDEMPCSECSPNSGYCGKCGGNRLSSVVFTLGAAANTTATERALLWLDADKLIGRKVKFRYQQVGTDVAPRIPIFLGFRDEADL